MIIVGFFVAFWLIAAIGIIIVSYIILWGLVLIVQGNFAGVALLAIGALLCLIFFGGGGSHISGMFFPD
jgi:hypothetical protein